MRAMELEELPKEIPMANLSGAPFVSLIANYGLGYERREGNRYQEGSGK
jgi:hypothetical protein